MLILAGGNNGTPLDYDARTPDEWVTSGEVEHAGSSEVSSSVRLMPAREINAPDSAPGASCYYLAA
jgi:hypothetical protein